MHKECPSLTPKHEKISIQVLYPENRTNLLHLSYSPRHPEAKTSTSSRTIRDTHFVYKLTIVNPSRS